MKFPKIINSFTENGNLARFFTVLHVIQPGTLIGSKKERQGKFFKEKELVLGRIGSRLFNRVGRDPKFSPDVYFPKIIYEIILSLKCPPKFLLSFSFSFFLVFAKELQRVLFNIKTTSIATWRNLEKKKLV